MNRIDGIERLVTEWLAAEAPDRAPQRLLLSVAGAIGDRGQRRPVGLRRLTFTWMAPAAAALLLIVVATSAFVVATMPRGDLPGNGGAVRTNGGAGTTGAASVLVGSGQVAGVDWAVRFSSPNHQLCVAGPVIADRTCSPYGPNSKPADLGVMVRFNGGVTSVLSVVDNNVASARVLLGNESVESSTVSLADLGISARGYAVAVPDGTTILTVIYLAADGAEIERTDVQQPMPPNPRQTPTTH